jgi:hypothetical protein
VAAKASNFVNLHVPKYTMVTIATVARSKQPEEKKHVADSDRIPL